MALAQRTLDLSNIPSESRDEAELYRYVRARAPGARPIRDGESVLFAKRTGKPLVLLAGHTDTVPAQGNLPGRIEDGAVVGLGASDMKGGLAVMIELGRWAAETELAYDLALLFFPREELGPAENPLPGVFERTGLVDEAQLVICLEPTDNTLQLGCLGNLNARAVFEGKSAHSARPWLGVNAIKLALDGLAAGARAEPRDVDIDGLVFREVISVTQIQRGHRGERDPGARRGDRSTSATRPTARRSPPWSVCVSWSAATSRSSPTRRRPTSRSRSPLVERLRAVGGFEVQPKQAWTNVADFAARGLDAINLGPGGTRYAHAVDERVEIASSSGPIDALQRFLAG